MPNNHVIHEVLFEIACSSRKVEQAVQRNLDRWIREELFAEIERLFDSFGQNTIHIDQVTVNAGSISSDISLQEMRGRLAKSLKESLDSFLPRAGHMSNHTLAVFSEQLLSQGLLPQSIDSPENLIETLLVQTPSSAAQMITESNSRSEMIQRLIRYGSPAAAESLIRELAPSGAEQITALFDRLTLNAESLPGDSAEPYLCRALLKITESNRAASGVALIDQILESWAEYTHLSKEKLMQLLYGTAPELPAFSPYETLKSRIFSAEKLSESEIRRSWNAVRDGLFSVLHRTGGSAEERELCMLQFETEALCAGETVQELCRVVIDSLDRGKLPEFENILLSAQNTQDFTPIFADSLAKMIEPICEELCSGNITYAELDISESQQKELFAYFVHHRSGISEECRSSFVQTAETYANQTDAKKFYGRVIDHLRQNKVVDFEEIAEEIGGSRSTSEPENRFAQICAELSYGTTTFTELDLSASQQKELFAYFVVHHSGISEECRSSFVQTAETYANQTDATKFLGRVIDHLLQNEVIDFEQIAEAIAGSASEPENRFAQICEELCSGKTTFDQLDLSASQQKELFAYFVDKYSSITEELRSSFVQTAETYANQTDATKFFGRVVEHVLQNEVVDFEQIAEEIGGSRSTSEPENRFAQICAELSYGTTTFTELDLPTSQQKELFAYFVAHHSGISEECRSSFVETAESYANQSDARKFYGRVIEHLRQNEVIDFEQIAEEIGGSRSTSAENRFAQICAELSSGKTTFTELNLPASQQKELFAYFVNHHSGISEELRSPFVQTAESYVNQSDAKKFYGRVVEHVLQNKAVDFEQIAEAIGGSRSTSEPENRFEKICEELSSGNITFAELDLPASQQKELFAYFVNHHSGISEECRSSFVQTAETYANQTDAQKFYGRVIDQLLQNEVVDFEQIAVAIGGSRSTSEPVNRFAEICEELCSGTITYSEINLPASQQKELFAYFVNHHSGISKELHSSFIQTAETYANQSDAKKFYGRVIDHLRQDKAVDFEQIAEEIAGSCSTAEPENQFAQICEELCSVNITFAELDISESQKELFAYFVNHHSGISEELRSSFVQTAETYANQSDSAKFYGRIIDYIRQNKAVDFEEIAEEIGRSRSTSEPENRFEKICEELSSGKTTFTEINLPASHQKELFAYFVNYHSGISKELHSSFVQTAESYANQSDAKKFYGRVIDLLLQNEVVDFEEIAEEIGGSRSTSEPENRFAKICEKLSSGKTTFDQLNLPASQQKELFANFVVHHSGILEECRSSFVQTVETYANQSDARKFYGRVIDYLWQNEVVDFDQITEAIGGSRSTSEPENRFAQICAELSSGKTTFFGINLPASQQKELFTYFVVHHSGISEELHSSFIQTAETYANKLDAKKFYGRVVELLVNNVVVDFEEIAEAIDSSTSEPENRFAQICEEICSGNITYAELDISESQQKELFAYFVDKYSSITEELRSSFVQTAETYANQMDAQKFYGRVIDLLLQNEAVDFEEIATEIGGSISESESTFGKICEQLNSGVLRSEQIDLPASQLRAFFSYFVGRNSAIAEEQRDSFLQTAESFAQRSEPKSFYASVIAQILNNHEIDFEQAVSGRGKPFDGIDLKRLCEETCTPEEIERMCLSHADQIAASLSPAQLIKILYRWNPGRAKLAVNGVLIAENAVKLAANSDRSPVPAKALWRFAVSQLFSGAPFNYQNYIAGITNFCCDEANIEPRQKVHEITARKAAVLLYQSRTPAAKASSPFSEPSGTVSPVGEIIANAGLVILAPYISRLFSMLGYLNSDGTMSLDAKIRAVHLLQFCADGSEGNPEHRLLLNRLICGIPLSIPLTRTVELTASEKETAESLLAAVNANWPPLKNTSVSGLRETFLMREGVLKREEESWHLKVSPKTLDILIDQMPWSFSCIKQNWMELPIMVEWR